MFNTGYIYNSKLESKSFYLQRISLSRNISLSDLYYESIKYFFIYVL